MSQTEPWPIQFDFVHVAGRCLVAYGWIAGLGTQVVRARLQADRWQCNLLNEGLLVPRPDVSQHLGAAHAAMAGPAGQAQQHEHGFFLLAELDAQPESSIAPGSAIRLTLQTQAGTVQHHEWPIVFGDDLAADTLRRHERAMRVLIARQSPRQVRLLTQLFHPPLVLRTGDAHGPEASHGPAPQLPLACVLGDHLVLAGHLPWPARGFDTFSAHWYPPQGDTGRAIAIDLLAHAHELPAPVPWPGAERDHLDPGQARAFVAVLPCPPGLATAGTDLEVHHEAAAGTGKQRLTLRVNPPDVQRRLASWLGTLDAVNGLAACEQLASAIPASEARQAWRDLLVSHGEARVATLPAYVDETTGAGRVSVFLEHAVLVPDAGILLSGWACADGTAPLVITYHAEGRSHPVSAHWVRRPRRDVQNHLFEQGQGVLDEPGFVCLVRLPGSQQPPLRPAYLRVASGSTVWRLKVPMPTAAEPARRLIRTLLSNVDTGCGDLRRLLDDHVGRAVQATWDRRPPPRSPAQQWQFGPRPQSPTVSLVVPLFGRTDLPDLQLALFTDDPDLHAAEILFVMDDPSLLHEFRQRCTDLYGMHRLPFTLAWPGDNLGFAGATNHGAALARAPLLLLLNSDVFPAEPGWLGRMARRYRQSPDSGLLGAKLLYEDGSVQHAGMDSVPHEPWQGLWINRHPHKGLSPHPLSGVRDARAVTAACVMVDAALYQQLGGLSEDYIIGDFEDSDLCYRVRQAGRACRVDLDVSLYHLERQSQALGDTGWRTALTLYNCWIHDQRWGRLLQEGAL